MLDDNTIVALSTAQGVGALAVIRLSGKDCIAVANKVFKGKDLGKQLSHTIHYGHIVGADKEIDEVMVSVFRAPKSFTTEDMVEISCHGSPFIVEQIIRLLVQNGARPATPGEFTLRAFMNGRIDLAQAEAVADLIASNSSAAHDLAIKQMRGGFSTQIKELRTRLVNFTSLIELELDFSEEDVEFANRSQLLSLIDEIQQLIAPLIDSFKLGNVLKHGVNTVIIGKPNAGKSTLLNTLLNEARAIVSEIPGTTRDTIEEIINIEGIQFRFIDTAGIRSTSDVIEQAGVDRALEKLKQSSVFIYLFDVNTTSPEELLHDVKDLALTEFKGLIVGNKIDAATNWANTAPFFWILKNNPATATINLHSQLLFISASTGKNVDVLKQRLYDLVVGEQTSDVRHQTQEAGNRKQETGKGLLSTESTIISNVRHHGALLMANESLEVIKTGIQNQITGELISAELRHALRHLGEISGEVTNDEILGNIFGKFCIGK